MTVFISMILCFDVGTKEYNVERLREDVGMSNLAIGQDSEYLGTINFQV